MLVCPGSTQVVTIPKNTCTYLMDASSFDSDHKRYQIQVNRSDTGQVCGVTIIIVKWCKLAQCYTALHQTACIIDHTVLPLEGQKAPGDFGVSLDLFSPPLNDVIEQLVSCIPREKSIELTGAISRWKWNEQSKEEAKVWLCSFGFFL